MAAAIETLEEFYRYKFDRVPEGLRQDSGYFNIFDLSETLRRSSPAPYQRRDFYKIMLIRGHNVFHYADRSLDVNGTALMFFNPEVPYKCERKDEINSGHFCIFKEGFFSDHLRANLKELPVFAPEVRAAYLLDPAQERLIEDIFLKMRNEIASDYTFKYDLLRSYVTELIHQAMKLEPSTRVYQHADANARITAVFRDLLERQFPIDSNMQQFRFRSAADFADKLNVHVNHLNRAVRTTTGKTTTELIMERLLSEAKALLAHTDWNVSEISYCLGFDQAANFSHFFKKHTATTPTVFRQQLGA